MTDFAQEHPSLRSRGTSHMKLNLLPASHFMPQQHPLDMNLDDRDMDIDLDGMVGYDTSLPSNKDNTSTTESAPFVSAHPSPEVSDESDGERERSSSSVFAKDEHSSGLKASIISDKPVSSASSATAIPVVAQKNIRRSVHLQPSDAEDLSLHLLLSPIPIPQRHHHHSHTRRTPPQSPLNSFTNSYSNSLSFKRSSFSSMYTPPGSATAAFPVPCSDSAAVDEIIRSNVRPNTKSHATEKAYFWSLGKLSEFSFSDRFVRSPIFDIKDTVPKAPANESASTDTAPESQTESTKSSWRLRLYPHGRGDRHRDSEYVGLYLQQESVGPVMNRRPSAVSGANAIHAVSPFSSSVPAPPSRFSGSPSSRRSVSGMSLPMTRRHVTLFIATEAGDCIAKQDLVEWFSGSEGGLGFPRFVPRSTVLDAVKKTTTGLESDDEDEEGEMNIVAGVIFHDL
ncbi:hypothetical protein FBU30_003347 [Linnemannia zychae]|nr:hypothetical protein FBU30_003347 [Linnemannia zychae]